MSDPQTGGFSLVVPNISTVAKEFFREQGVNLEPPETIFFNDRLGILFVYATPQDLDVIERVISEMIMGTVPAPTDGSDSRQRASNWARAGQASYEAGEMDNAKRDLEKALSLDPDNQGAQYYLNLVSQAKATAPSGQGSAFNFPANVVINPTNVLDPQQNAENYSKQWADDGLLRGKEYYEPGPSRPVSSPVNAGDLQQRYSM